MFKSILICVAFLGIQFSILCAPTLVFAEESGKSAEELMKEITARAKEKVQQEREQERADAPQKAMLDKGNYSEVSDDYINRQKEGAVAALAKGKNFLADIVKERAPYVEIMEKTTAQLKESSEKIAASKEKILGCFGGDKNAANAAVKDGDYSKSTCSKEEVDAANKIFQEENQKTWQLEQDYKSAESEYKYYDGFYRRANQDILDAEHKINQYEKAAEKKKEAVAAAALALASESEPVEEPIATEPVEPESVALEASPQETDGVLPPTITSPATTNQKKAESVIGMASTTDDTTSTTTTTNAGAKASTNSEGLFGTLTKSGVEVFTGLREIIFAVAGFGITAVAIGGFFGNLNWKWLSSIIIGLVVVSTASALINYMVDSEAITTGMVTDTLISAR